MSEGSMNDEQVARELVATIRSADCTATAWDAATTALQAARREGIETALQVVHSWRWDGYALTSIEYNLIAKVRSMMTAAIRALPVSGAVDPWCYDMEAAKRNGRTAILVWVPENLCIYTVTWKDGDEGGWLIFGGGWRDHVQRPTAWMPLPTPPKQGERA